jgi:hypothetical protein
MNAYRVYRANKQENGTASEWQLSFKSQEKYNPWKLFYSIASQAGIDENGNARFDWENATRVKMDVSDLCKILAVLEHKQSQAGHGGKIFHKHGNDNKIINFIHNENSNNYFMKVSHQSPAGVVTLQQNLSIGEGCALRVLIEQAIIKLTNWGTRGTRKNHQNHNMQSNPATQGAFQQAI